MIVAWIISVICVTLSLGECYYRYLEKKKSKHLENLNSTSSSQSIEHDFRDLDIESPNAISRKKLQMRGSWRLAQDHTMSYVGFQQERDNEYKQML